ncbi:hypothetical protein CC80DRAFT_293722 [Byssothecium circinans]|uniref:Extracellular membrane protein CFEM domain-containing protein n=1 Tax=Byssothecium circinans TaxID=147558 RepID=A0A6A5U6A9_9PLEO|nr:hypothetical protein CC80DRAFT_293722 [Byssothecium circinans]
MASKFSLCMRGLFSFVVCLGRKCTMIQCRSVFKVSPNCCVGGKSENGRNFCTFLATIGDKCSKSATDCFCT